MNNLEERLTGRLHDRADRVELRLTADAVKRHSDDLPATDIATRRPGRIAFAAAACLLTILGGVALLSRDRTGTRLEVVAPTVIDQGPSPTTAFEVLAPPEELSIAAIDAAPAKVASTGTVFEAELVGRVEAGPPSELLLADEPQLAGAICVASELALGCAADDGAARFTYGSNDGTGWHVVGGEQDVVLLAVEGIGVFVAGLPDIVTEVEAVIDDERYVQSPAQGTVAFPLGSTARLIQLVGVDAVGTQRWDSLPFDLPRSADRTGGADGEQTAIKRMMKELADLWAAQTALSWLMEWEAHTLEDPAEGTPELFFRDDVLAVGDNELLLSVSAGDPLAAVEGSSDRGQPLRVEGTARVFVGTDSDEARAVELFDGDRIVYVRSESAEVALDVETLVDIALVVNRAMAAAG